MPLSIVFTAPGNYTIEDDGIRGNNTSVVRDGTGAIIQTFTHPADALSFVTITPGVNLTFNVLDSFGTATVTVGNLSDPAASPDSIVVRSMRADPLITLVSNGTITEGGSDAAADIISSGVLLSAVHGIGTAANALEIQTVVLEAETNDGGINLANFGNVQIGGLSASVDGLDVVSSGNLVFTTTGFILLNDSTGPEMVHGGDLSGNVTLSAIGADADIFVNLDRPAVSAPGGAITLNAGRDVAFGTAGTNYNNDVLATTGVTINAGRDFILDGTSNVRTGAFGGVVGGPIDIQAGRNINLSNTNGGLQTIQAFAGDIILTTGPGGAFIENAAFPGAVQTSDDIILNADAVLIFSGGLNTTGIGSVTILPVTPGLAIDIGSAVDSPGTIALSDAEFDLLFTLNVNVGDLDSGPVEFSAPINPFIVDNLLVRSGNEILVDASITLFRTLTLRAGDDIFFTPSGSFTTTNGGFTGLVDLAQDDGGAGGMGNLGGTFTVTTAVLLNGNAENDTLSGGGAAETLDGQSGNDALNGGGGNDRLIGGAGVDNMFGGPGDDFFFVDSAADTVAELAGEGAADRIFSSASYALAAGSEVEMITPTDFASTTPLNFTGNAVAQTIYGNAGDNRLDGGGGGDTLVGLGGNDFYFVRNSADRAVEAAGGGTGDRVFAATSFALEAGSQVEILSTIDNLATTAINLTGNALAQFIFGNAGANNLDGGTGSGDVLLGLNGDDNYVVNNSADRVVEAVGGGLLDRVFARASFTLEAGSEVEEIRTFAEAGTDPLNLTGNAFSQAIRGNAGANTLDGGGGGDNMRGLGGNDNYFVRAAGDRTVEAAGEGNDRVFSGISFTIEAGSSIEMLTPISFASTDALNFTGNALSQSIFGTAGNNNLDGGGGGDTLVGLGGDDRYFIRHVADRAGEDAGNGNDRVFAAVSFTLEAGSHVEILSTIDNLAATAINLTGNELANTLFGNAGANVLDGKGSLDSLVGMGGADAFAFTTALGAGNVDTVSDFAVGVDEIRLAGAIFAGIGGTLDAAEFVTGSAAADANDRIIYNPVTGQLFYDADGAGGAAQVLFASLDAGLALAASDFAMI